MTREVAKSICDTVGMVCRFIGEVDKDSGRFMCVKVNLDISLPLCQGQEVSLEKGAKT